MRTGTAATLSTCKTTLPMAAYSSRPAPRTGRRGRVADRDGHAGQQEVGTGAQRAAPKDRPAGSLMCARPAKVNPPPRAAPLRGAAGKVVSRGADNHMDVGSAHRIFRGLRSGPRAPHSRGTTG